MYQLPYLAAFLLAFITLSYARHTVFVSQNGDHSYSPGSSESDVCMNRRCVIDASDILTTLDETVDPCDDFHRFACGGWLKRAEVSEDKPRVGTISEMEDNLTWKLKELVESQYQSSDPPFVKLLKDFYNTCLEVDSIEEEESERLKKMLSRLGGWPVVEGNEWDESTFNWLDTLILFRKVGYDHNILMRLNVQPKSQNETINIIHLGWLYSILPYNSNSTLGLADTKIAEYFKKMMKSAKLLGADETTAEKELQEVVDFMIALDNISEFPEDKLEDESEDKFEDELEDKSEEESEDKSEKESEENENEIFKYYTVKELQEEVPSIPWLKFFNGILNDEVYESDILHVEKSIPFIKNLVDLLASTDNRVIANYMIMRAVLESASYLPGEWNLEDQKEKPIPRWKTCLSLVKSEMETALSSYYVRHYFTGESKDEAMVLVKYIREEFLKMLAENDWMDEKTRKKAEDKANALKYYIGYPDELLNDTFVMKEYKNLPKLTESHFENMMAFQKIAMDQRLSYFRKSRNDGPDMRFEFIVTVNAFYVPDDNSIGVPAGILHDAFYDKERPNYMNFGAIGYVIGHEITHGFDENGRHYDKNGEKINWWDKESDIRYRKKVQCIIDQYDNYTMDNGLKVNGESTQNENIADNGGLKEAYRAYQSWVKDNGIEPLLPGLKYSQNQFFWLSAAHIWCSKLDTSLLKEYLLWDPHSPARFRVIGPMSNLEEFSNDFKCPDDSPMNKKYKCEVW